MKSLVKKRAFYENLLALMDSIKGYYKIHRDIVLVIHEIFVNSIKELKIKEIDYKLLRKFDKKKKDLIKKIKFLKSYKKGEELYKEILQLMRVYELEMYYFHRYLRAFQESDKSSMSYYIFAFEEMLKKGESSAEKIADLLEEFLKPYLRSETTLNKKKK